MSLSRSFEENYKLKAEKRDLEIEVRHLKEGMLSKNQEISNLKTKLRRTEAELSSLHEYLASHITFLSTKLNPPPDSSHPSPVESIIVSSPSVSQSPSLTGTVVAKNTLYTKLKVTTASSSHPVSRSQPVLTRSANVDGNVKGSAGSAKTCDKCCAKFVTARKLRMHMNIVHVNILVSDDDFTPPDNLYQTPKKVKVRVSSPEASINSDLVKHKGSNQVQCQDCGRCLLRRNLAVHKNMWCKGAGVEKENVGEPSDDCLGGGGNRGPVEKVNMKIRCVEGTINGVKLNINLKVNPSTRVEKVVDLFSKRAGLAMDRLELRCKGRVLGLEEEVLSTEGETVWVNVVGVKWEAST